MRNASAYAISNCAATRLAENLAVETRVQGISVFSINPGFVRMAFTQAVAESPEGETWLPGIHVFEASGFAIASIWLRPYSRAAQAADDLY